MTKSFFLGALTFTCICFSVQAQNLIGNGLRENVLYAGVTNLITITFDKEHCNEIRLESDKGVIERDSCKFRFKMDSITPVLFEIYKGKKLLDTVSLQVHSISDVRINIKGIKHSFVPRLFIDSLIVESETLNRYPESTPLIIGFEAEAYNGDSLLFSISETGNLVSEEVADRVKSLKKGELFVLKNFKIDIDGYVFTLERPFVQMATNHPPVIGAIKLSDTR